jgi:hypothetical protein
MARYDNDFEAGNIHYEGPWKGWALEGVGLGNRDLFCTKGSMDGGGGLLYALAHHLPYPYRIQHTYIVHNTEYRIQRWNSWRKSRQKS